jgi:hypothetical protein
MERERERRTLKETEREERYAMKEKEKCRKLRLRNCFIDPLRLQFTVCNENTGINI